MTVFRISSTVSCIHNSSNGSGRYAVRLLHVRPRVAVSSMRDNRWQKALALHPIQTVPQSFPLQREHGLPGSLDWRTLRIAEMRNGWVEIPSTVYTYPAHLPAGRSKNWRPPTALNPICNSRCCFSFHCSRAWGFLSMCVCLWHGIYSDGKGNRKSDRTKIHRHTKKEVARCLFFVADEFFCFQHVWFALAEKPSPLPWCPRVTVTI